MSIPKAIKSLWSETPVSGYEPEDLLILSRTKLLFDFPFFGKLAHHLIFIETDRVPTAAVDAKGRFYYNPYFINACTMEAGVHVVAHEVMHLVQRAAARFPEKGIHAVWNKAADCTVNHTLRDAKILPPDDWQPVLIGYTEDWDKYYEWTTERIYYDLLTDIAQNSECEACKQEAQDIVDENKKHSGGSANPNHDKPKNKDESGDGEGNDEGDGDGSGSGSGSGEGEGDGDSGPEHTCGDQHACCSGSATDAGEACGDAKAHEDWKRHVLTAAEQVGRGNLPSSIQELIGEIVEPSVDWKEYFRSKSSSAFNKGRYTFKRPSRRSMAVGVRLPRRDPDKVAGIAFLDSSGSISHNTLVQFVSEAVGIMKQTGATKMYIGVHDVFVTSFIEVTPDTILSDLKFPRGGTSHIDVFKIINGEESEHGFKLPKGYHAGVVVCMTDMESEFPTEAPAMSVLWAIPSQYYHREPSRYYNGPNWGLRVEVKVHG